MQAALLLGTVHKVDVVIFDNVSTLDEPLYNDIRHLLNRDLMGLTLEIFYTLDLTRRYKYFG